MTETAISRSLKPAAGRASRGTHRETRASLKGTLIAGAVFAVVYGATLVVLFAPKDVLQGQPASYVPPVMGTTITMPTTLPDFGAELHRAVAGVTPKDPEAGQAP